MRQDLSSEQQECHPYHHCLTFFNECSQVQLDSLHAFVPLFSLSLCITYFLHTIKSHKLLTKREFECCATCLCCADLFQEERSPSHVLCLGFRRATGGDDKGSIKAVPDVQVSPKHATEGQLSCGLRCVVWVWGCVCVCGCVSVCVCVCLCVFGLWFVNVIGKKHLICYGLCLL